MSKYLTVEFIVYLLHLLLFLFYIIPTIGASIRTKCDGYPICSYYLRPTYFGYLIDTGDDQWRDLRSHFSLLWVTLIVTTGGRRMLHYILNWWNSSMVDIKKRNDEMSTMVSFRLFVGIIFLFVMHGFHSLVILLIAYIGFRIVRWQIELKLKSSVLTWTFSIFILFFKESYRIKDLYGFHFLRPIFDTKFGGLYRWQLPANFLILRIISYSMDYMWAVEYHNDKKQSVNATELSIPNSNKTNRKEIVKQNIVGISYKSQLEKDDLKGTSKINSSTKEPAPAKPTNETKMTKDALGKSEKSRAISDYDLLNYLSYIMYTPLYTAGPIITYNAYMENVHHPQSSEDPWQYSFRWIICFLIMEIMTNKFPCFAVMKSGLFPYLGPAELALVCYLTVKMMWLKFLITWRFFRLWAIADGTLPPENMTRCMSNNYSLGQFWRSWHASFNKWIVRYMYKPLGGRDKQLYNVWPIFMFVALWHDLEFKLFLWGLLNGVFYLLEVFGILLSKSEMMKSLPYSIIRLITVMSGATYIIILIAVNLIGYAIGMNGVTTILAKLISWEGFAVLLASYYLLCMAVSFMNFLERKEEGDVLTK